MNKCYPYFFVHDFFSQGIPLFEQFLARHVGQQVNYLEIGTFEGRGAVWLLENILTHPKSTITCIDPWEYEWEEDAHIYTNFKHNISFHPQDKIICYKETSSDVLPTLQQNYYDFIFVDGDHSSKGALEDPILAWRLLKLGEHMAFDDYELHEEKYAPDHTYPKESIDAFLRAYRTRFNMVHKGWQVWLHKIMP